MKLREINPHIRFASKTYFDNTVTFNVFDSRIFYVLNGKMEIITKNKHHFLKPGSTFYCASGSVYTFEKNEGCELLAINFDLTQIRNSFVNSCQPFEINQKNKPRYKNEVYIEDCEFLNEDISLDDMPEACVMLKKIIKEFSEKKIFFRERSSAILKELLIDMHRHSLPAMASSDIIDKLITHIHLNLAQKIQNSDLASIAGYHEYHLNRLFLRHTGMTIHRYILECRINEAKKLLLNTNMTFSEIAEHTGFNSNTHFSSSFRNLEKCSPLEYKLNMKNKI